MKKYPYTESTDMIVYKAKAKKDKKPHIWAACISSALAASIFTAGAFGAGYYVLNKNSNNPSDQLINGQQPSMTQSIAADNENASTLSNANGKQEMTTTQIAKQCGRSVVGVINKTTVQTRSYIDPFSGRTYYYNDPSQAGSEVEQGSGSGIIISSSGYIVTNQHVIDGASKVSVILNTGEEFDATIVGQDSKTDLAVLKIDSNVELHPAALGDSTTVEVGELAVAIGNPLGQEFSGTVTQGIVSATNRTMTVDNRTYNLLQTDAAINSGNSGGALFNKYGEVIGINSIKISKTGVDGLGFAIAISEAKPIIEDLMSNGYVTGRPLVGITVMETRYGLFISSVSAGSGAEKAGLQPNDFITKVDGQAVKSSSELNELRDKKKPGETMTFTIMRDGKLQDFQVVLQEDSTTTSSSGTNTYDGNQ